MSIWISRCLWILSVIGLMLSIRIGYGYVKRTRLHSVTPVSLQETKLPSVIPNFRLAAHRQILTPIDLRRADLQMGQLDAHPKTEPILDKVLFVPKKFG